MPAPDLMKLLIKNWSKHGITPTVTLSTLTLGAQDAETGWYAKSYSNSSISMFIIPKSLQFQVLKGGLFVEYDAVGFTKNTVQEGDLIEDAATNIYLIVAVRDANILSQYMYSAVDLKLQLHAAVTGVWVKWPMAFKKFMRTVEKNAAATGDMTLYPMTIGLPDGTTGWYVCTYPTHSTISCVILNARAQTRFLRSVKHTSYSHYGYTLDDVNAGDIIQDQAVFRYRVRSVLPISVGNKLVFYELGLERGEGFNIDRFFALMLDVRALHMGFGQLSVYLENVIVDIYLGGVLVTSGLTDALGTFKTFLLPGVYDIILHKSGYQTITKHETLTIQTELMVNLPGSESAMPIGPPGGLVATTILESTLLSASASIAESFARAETLEVGASKGLNDSFDRVEALEVTNS